MNQLALDKSLSVTSALNQLFLPLLHCYVAAVAAVSAVAIVTAAVVDTLGTLGTLGTGMPRPLQQRYD